MRLEIWAFLIVPLLVLVAVAGGAVLLSERIARTNALADADDVPRAVSGQVLGWFGTIAEGKWAMDARAVVREIGLGILREHRVNWVVGE